VPVVQVKTAIAMAYNISKAAHHFWLSRKDARKLLVTGESQRHKAECRVLIPRTEPERFPAVEKS
jgi:hypothetical protein